MARLEAVKLAILFHDPPWKPWTVLGRLPGLHERLYQVFRDSVDYALGEADCGSYKELKEELKKGLRAHELQGALFLAVLAGELGRRRVGDAAVAAFEALRLLCRRDSSVERADAFSSALDRLVVHAAENALGRKLGTNRLAYKNPFDPELVIVHSSSPSTDRLEEFVRVYVDTVAGLVERACSAGGNHGCGLLLVHVAFLLMEHLWYRVFPGQAPPADTRVPGHTVFDHVSAAMAMANWFSGARGRKAAPRGYLVVVDLASVQSWIGEARRLRDMWAASWLASFLAWRTVEPLVERYGPDVLLQPPARLHPFYTAWLLSKLGFRKWSDLEKGARESRAVDVLRRVLEPWFQGWPVDPTVPSRAVLVLPPDAGSRDEIGRLVAAGYSGAWRSVVSELAGYVEEFIESLKQNTSLLGKHRELRGLRALLRLAEENSIRELLEGLEPPLPLRLTVVDVEEAYREYLRWLDKGKVWDKALQKLCSGDCHDTARKVLESLRGDRDVLFYAFLQLVYLPARERRVLIRASRRSGRGYLSYAGRMYSAYLGSREDEGEGIQPRLCTVCGRAIALIDAPEPGSDGYRELMRGIEDSVAGRLLAEARGERLCPYCLAKRMLRTLLQGVREAGREGIAGRLVGLELEGSHMSRLVASSVDAFTSRLHVNRSRLVEALKGFISGLSGDELLKLWSLAASGLLGYSGAEKWLEDSERKRLLELIRDRAVEADVGGRAERILGALESSIPSLLVDAGLRSSVSSAPAAGEVGARLVKAVEEAAAGGSAYYAIVAADGDFMGRGVLQGRLGLGPGEYMRSLLEVADDAARDAIAGAFAALVETLEEVLVERGREARERECGELLRGCSARRLTLIVTPSYHYAVSRALAASAVMDRAIVEMFKGFLVYAGGDDLIAILPPSTEDDDKPYPALAAAIAARRSYWGLGVVEGFHVAVPGKNGGRVDLGVVVPAIRGAGRSTVVYYAHAKTPMWLSFRTAHELLDAKDHILYVDLAKLPYSGAVRGCKDVLIVASEAGGLAALPSTLMPELRGRDSGVPGAAVLALLAAVERCRAGERNRYDPVLSASVIRDLVGDTRLLVELAARSRDAALGLIEHHLRRNYCKLGARGEKTGAQQGARDYVIARRLAEAGINELNRLAEKLGQQRITGEGAAKQFTDAVATTGVAFSVSGEHLVEVLEREGLANKLGECLTGAPTVSMIFHAAGLTRTAARRTPGR